MRRWIIAAAAVFAAGFARMEPQEGAAAAEALLVTGVAVVDVERGDVSGPVDILVEDGVIRRVAAAGTVAVDPGVRVIDGAGLYALAGLIDVHAHLGDGGVGEQTDAGRRAALTQFLRYGVTTLFVPGGTGGGDADLERLRAGCSATPCPGLSVSGSIITAPGSHPVSTIFHMADDVAAAETEARGVTVLRPGTDLDALIASKQALGVDAVKIVIEDGPPPWFPKPRLTDEQVAALARAAHARGLPVFAHVSRSDHVRVAVEAGLDGVMHAPVDRMPDALIDDMAEREVFYVTTFALYDGIRTWARGEGETDPYALKGVPPEVVAGLTHPGFLGAAPESEAQADGYLAAAADNLRRVMAAGVPVALGTDTNNPFVFPGYSAHEELARMVEAGLTPAQALRAATVGGAAFVRASDRLGRIAEGYEADLLLLSANPLEDVRNSRRIAHVISDGREVEGPVSAD